MSKVFWLASFLTSVMLSPLRADQPGHDWITVEQAISNLRTAGYTSIGKIEADDGHWKGEGMKDGQKHEFRVDPRTGAITKDEVDR